MVKITYLSGILIALLLIAARGTYSQTSTPSKKQPIKSAKLTAAPSPDATPVPTSISEPTHQPAATPTPNPALVSYCTDHDPTQYHGLFNSQNNCWYDHEHGDDPSLVNDIFGPVSNWWGGTQTISYPWQTFMYPGSNQGGGHDFPAPQGHTENEMKHQGYKWFVRRDLPCSSQFTDGCVKAVRTLDHAIASAQGANVRYHSFATEMLVCPESRPDDCGIVRTGGWQDKGVLAVDNQFLTEFGPRNGAARIHYQNIGNSHFGTWYGGTSKAATVTQFEDMWGLVQAENPTNIHLFCPDDPSNCGYNNSKRQLHLVGAMLTGQELRWLRQQGHLNSQNKVNFTGFTNRYGNIVKDASCTSVSLDCIPLVYQNYDPTVMYQHRGDAREYDTSIGVLPHSPIRYPN